MMKEEKEDELLGNWYTEEESIGFSAVWWCGVTFNMDNTGIHYHHSGFNTDETPFIWQRLNATTIKIFMEENDETDEWDIEEDIITNEGEEDIATDEWTTIEYVIIDYIGVLFATPYKKLTDKGYSSFWIVPGHLIRSLKMQEKLAHLENEQGAINKSEQESQKITT